MIDLSVVIPIRNEAPSLVELHRELTETLGSTGRSYEIIIVDDGSTDEGFAILERLQAGDRHLRVIRLRRNFGQTAAFAAGFAYARGALIVTSDGDLQNDPRDIPAMVTQLEGGFDIVCGWRKDRKDALVSRRLPSTLANALISTVTGVHLHDYGCSLKIFRAEIVKDMKLYGEMHRFLPAIASEQTSSIGEMVVNHRARKVRRVEMRHPDARCRVVLDLLTVKFLLSYSTRPLQIFGLVGLRDGLPRRADRRLAGGTSGWRDGHVAGATGTAAAARHPADLHRAPAGDARPARRDAGTHVPRVPGQAHLRDPRGSPGRPRIGRLGNSAGTAMNRQ